MFLITEKISRHMLASYNSIVENISEPVIVGITGESGRYTGRNVNVDIIRLTPDDVFTNMTTIDGQSLVWDMRFPPTMVKYPHEIVTNTVAWDGREVVETRTCISSKPDSSYGITFVNHCWTAFSKLARGSNDPYIEMFSMKSLNGYIMLYTQGFESQITADSLRVYSSLLERYAMNIRATLTEWGIEI